MIAAVLLMALLSMVVFTMFGRVQRWSWRLSLAYAGTMTVFLAAVVAANTLIMSALS